MVGLGWVVLGLVTGVLGVIITLLGTEPVDIPVDVPVVTLCGVVTTVEVFFVGFAVVEANLEVTADGVVVDVFVVDVDVFLVDGIVFIVVAGTVFIVVDIVVVCSVVVVEGDSIIVDGAVVEVDVGNTTVLVVFILESVTVDEAIILSVVVE